MSIKVEVKVATELNESMFPLMAKGKVTKAVVLFTAPQSGIVLEPGESDYLHMHRLNDLVNVRDSEYWKILPVGSTVTLTQGGL